MPGSKVELVICAEPNTIACTYAGFSRAIVLTIKPRPVQRFTHYRSSVTYATVVTMMRQSFVALATCLSTCTLLLSRLASKFELQQYIPTKVVKKLKIYA